MYGSVEMQKMSFKSSFASNRVNIVATILVAAMLLTPSLIIPHAQAPTTPAWVDRAEMPSPRADPASAVCNGILYVIGGYYQGPTDARRETFAYDPLTDSWTQKADMPTARWGALAVEFEGLIYVFAGTSYSAGITVTEVYDPETDTWTAKAQPSPYGLNYGLMGARFGDKIYLFQLGMHYEYDPAADTYTWRRNMPTPRNFGVCVVVGDAIYIIGGQHYGGSPAIGFIAHDDNEAYYPASNTWATKAPMPVSKWGSAREGSVIEGKIYVPHGRDWTSYFLDNYVYDPLTDSWEERSPPNHLRAGATYGAINGKLYAVGGVHALVGDPYVGLGYVEEYDPSIDALPTVTVTVSEVDPAGSGLTVPPAGAYDVVENGDFSISATPLPGFLFDHWELDGVSVSTQTSYTFNVTSSNHTINALFAAIPTVTVAVPDGSPFGGGTTDPAAGEYVVPENTLFEIIAAPDSMYFFDHWELDSIGVSTETFYSFNVSTSNHTIQAFFAAMPTVTVTVLEVSPVGGGTTAPTAGAYEVVENGDFSITATPLPGYVFSHWELDGAPDGFELSYTFNVGISNHTVLASFTELVSAQIDSCDSLQNWIPVASLLSVNDIDFQEGSGAIEIATITTPMWHIYAILQKPMDLSEYSTLQIWVKISDSTKPLRLMIATNWGNYNVYTITGLTSNVWTLVSIDLSTPASTVGTINFSSISFFRFNYEVQRTTANFTIDDIQGIYG